MIGGHNRQKRAYKRWHDRRENEPKNSGLKEGKTEYHTRSCPISQVSELPSCLRPPDATGDPTGDKQSQARGIRIIRTWYHM